MSELNSLFAKIHISKENFNAFMNAKPTEPKLDNNWLAWWDSKEMYSKTELQEGSVYCYQDPSNEVLINGWKETKQTYTFSDYDLKNEIWHFGIIMFSENYSEMIPGLAFIKSDAEFKQENESDFAIVYSYFWGDEGCNAYINYENGKGLFNTQIQNKSDVNSEILQYAEDYLTKKWGEFAEAGETDEYD